MIVLNYHSVAIMLHIHVTGFFFFFFLESLSAPIVSLSPLMELIRLEPERFLLLLEYSVYFFWINSSSLSYFLTSFICLCYIVLSQSDSLSFSYIVWMTCILSSRWVVLYL